MEVLIIIAVCVVVVAALIWLVPLALNSITIKTNKMFDHPEMNKLLERGLEDVQDEMAHKRKLHDAKREAELRRAKAGGSDDAPRF